MKLIHFDSNTINNRIKNAIQERLRCKAKSLPEDVHIHIGPKPPLSGPGATIRKAALERPLYNYIFLDYNSTFSLDRLIHGTSSKKMAMFFVAVPSTSGWNDKNEIT